jgi:hypothetical protein
MVGVNLEGWVGELDAVALVDAARLLLTHFERIVGDADRLAEIAITAREYWIGPNKVVDPVVHYADRSLVCDNLPLSLTKLIPVPWGNATTAAWVPFVERAIVLGLL